MSPKNQAKWRPGRRRGLVGVTAAVALAATSLVAGTIASAEEAVLPPRDRAADEFTSAPLEGSAGSDPGVRVLGSVSWLVVDPEGAPLGETTWQIENAAGDVVAKEIADCEAEDCDDRELGRGEFLVDGLATGEYVLTQASAPVGYLKHIPPIEFAITESVADFEVATPLTNEVVEEASDQSDLGDEVPDERDDETTLVPQSGANEGAAANQPGDSEDVGSQSTAPGQEQGLPSQPQLLAEVAPMILGPEGLATPYIYWNVVDTDGNLVPGATFTLQGPRSSNTNWGTTQTVTDCIQAPCTGPDKDPDPGEFQVQVTGNATNATASNQRYRVQMTSPPPGYTATGTGLGPTSQQTIPAASIIGNQNTATTWTTFRMPIGTGSQDFVVQKIVTDATIQVQVSGDRTSLTSVSGLAGVTLGLYSAETGGSPLFTCVSNAAGICAFTIPNTANVAGSNANRDARYWVRQIGTASSWYTNPSLGVGTTVASSPYRFQTGTELRAGQVYTSTSSFMVGTGNTNNTASSGIWQNSRANPTFDQQCGINVALVHDLSNSLSSQDLAALKAASTGFVDALTGTDSQVAIYTFATSGPAAGANNSTMTLTPVSTASGAATAKTKINGLSLPGGNDGGTNWDRGLYQVASADEDYDVVFVITDGNPTYYSNGNSTEGPGGRTRFRELEYGIFSANAIKAEGSRVVAFGVGDGVGSSASGLNLRSISGEDLGTDYFQESSYVNAAAKLRELALGDCSGTVTVVKQVVPEGSAPGTTTGAEPAGGWEFTGQASNGVTVDPGTRETAPATGAASFALTFPGGITDTTFTATETQQSGYTLVPIGGQNATCTRVDTNAPVPSTNVGELGFSVAANSAYPVSCTVYNRAPSSAATVAIHKRWVVDGQTYANGEQPGGMTAQGQINGTSQAWGVVRTGLTAGDSITVGETTAISQPLCELKSSRLVLANGESVDLALPSTQTLEGGNNSYTIENEVECETRLRLTKTLRQGDASPSAWTLDAFLTGQDAVVSGTTGATGAVEANTRYLLAESGGSAEYVQWVDANANVSTGATGSWLCAEIDPTTDAVIPGYADGLNGGVTVPLGRFVSCEAVNQTAVLTLLKTVINDNGGTAMASDWQLTATPETYLGLSPKTVTGAESDEGENSFAIRPGHTYTLAEAPSTGEDVAAYRFRHLEQYVNGTWVEVVENTDPDGFPRKNDDGEWMIQAAAESTPMYRFVNDDIPARLSLVKAMDNPEEGTGYASAQDWVLTATLGDSANGFKIEGISGSSLVTNAEAPTGTYALTEAWSAASTPNKSSAYNWSALRCESNDGAPVPFTEVSFPLSGDSVGTPANLTLGPGNDVTCTYTNTPKSASVAWQKVGPDRAALAGSEWVLTGPGLPSGGVAIQDCDEDDPDDCQGEDINPAAGSLRVKDLTAWGEYTLKETKAPAGYQLPNPNPGSTFTIAHDSLAYEFTDPFENEPRDVPALPLTGGQSAALFSVLGAGVIGAGIAFAIWMRRRSGSTLA